MRRITRSTKGGVYKDKAFSSSQQWLLLHCLQQQWMRHCLQQQCMRRITRSTKGGVCKDEAVQHSQQWLMLVHRDPDPIMVTK